MAEVISVEDGFTLGMNEVGVSQKLKRVTYLLMHVVVILIPHLNYLLKIKYILKVLSILLSLSLCLFFY